METHFIVRSATMNDVLLDFKKHYILVALDNCENGLYDYGRLIVQYRYKNMLFNIEATSRFFKSIGLNVKAKLNRHGIPCYIIKRYAIFFIDKSINTEYYMNELDWYEGPEIPIMCSTVKHNTTRNYSIKKKIQTVIVPSFVMYSKSTILPHYKLWRWSPCKEITLNEFIELITKEYHEGGWEIGLRDKPMIPYKTGRMF